MISARRIYAVVVSVGVVLLIAGQATAGDMCASSDSTAVVPCPHGTNTPGCCKAKAACHPTTVNTQAFAQMIASNTPMTIVDARSGKYDDGRRIPGAQQLAPDAKEEDIAKALPDKNAMIVVYCASIKCPASAELAKRLIALGYTKVHRYPSGIEGWITAGYTVTNVTAQQIAAGKTVTSCNVK